MVVHNRKKIKELETIFDSNNIENYTVDDIIELFEQNDNEIVIYIRFNGKIIKVGCFYSLISRFNLPLRKKYYYYIDNIRYESLSVFRAVLNECSKNEMLDVVCIDGKK